MNGSRYIFSPKVFLYPLKRGIGAWRLSVVKMDGLGVTEEMLLRAVELAGGATNLSGHYPISEEIRERLAAVMEVGRL